MKATLKRLRGSQPFNRAATDLARGLCRIAGHTPEIFPRHLHRIGDVQERLPNGEVLHLRSKGDDWVTNLVFWKGWKAYEPGTIDLFYRVACRSTVILDVGAYVGFFSIIAALANRNARVFAFEALEPIYQRLLENIRLNKLENVECVNSAISDAPGSAQFFYSKAALREGLPTSSSLSENFMATAPELVGVEVLLTSIDEFVHSRSLDPVDLVKIDTETTEPAVLKGMRQVLPRDRPTIVCEILRGRVDTSAIEAVLQPLGYKYFLLAPTGPVAQDRIEGHPEYLNYLFTVDPKRDLG